MIANKKYLDDTPLPLTVRLLVHRLDEFIDTYYPDIMQGGMFIRAEPPEAIQLGMRVQLRFLSQSSKELFSGVGVVAWIQNSGKEKGMGVQFLRLNPKSHTAYRKMLRLSRSQKRLPVGFEFIAASQQGLLENDDPVTLPIALQESQEWSEHQTRPMPQNIREELLASCRPHRITPIQTHRRRKIPLPTPYLDQFFDEPLTEKLVIPLE